MPKLSITGYQTGFGKTEIIKILRQELDLDEVNSVKMSDAVISGNVISLDFQDLDTAHLIAEKLSNAGAAVQLDGKNFENRQ